MKKLEYVDALRGYAIFFVIIAHVGQMYPLNYPQYLKSIIDFGPRGVQLFFIVSAFTLFLSGSKRFKTDEKPVLFFFIRRFFRIAPLYYLGIIFYSFFKFNTDFVTFGNILRNLFFVNDLYPYHSLVPGGWSISTEMLFYLFVPLLYKSLNKLDNAVFFTFIAFLIAVIYKIIISKIDLNISAEFYKDLGFPYFFPFSIPVFGIGISFYFIIFENDSNIKPVLLFLLAILVLIGIIYESGILYMYFQTISFGVIALAFSKARFNIVVNPIIKYFGKISYSMYMSHFLIIDWIAYSDVMNMFLGINSERLIFYFVTKLCLTLILTTILGSILYHFIEVPGQNIGKTLIERYKKNTPINSK